MKDLFSAAIKSTNHTRSPGGVERCIDVLNYLKSFSLTVKDILQLSTSLFKLEPLRRHRNPKIRNESQSLFDSWLTTLYAQGRDHSFKAGPTQFRLKPKKKETTGFLELKRKEDPGPLAHDTVKMKKKAKTKILVSIKEQDQKTLTRQAVVKIKTKTDACKSVTTKQPCGSVKDAGKVSSVTATALPQQSRRNIKDTDGNVTTTTLIPPPRRHDASSNPKSKIEEMVELFEAVKKAADVANAKRILSGKADAYRCVEAISLLMEINLKIQYGWWRGLRDLQSIKTARFAMLHQPVFSFGGRRSENKNVKSLLPRRFRTTLVKLIEHAVRVPPENLQRQ